MCLHPTYRLCDRDRVEQSECESRGHWAGILSLRKLNGECTHIDVHSVACAVCFEVLPPSPYLLRPATPDHVCNAVEDVLGATCAIANGHS